MRNIKRVLSLALASVMLLGMMVVGSSAAFNDADKIVNTKAATVTAGLGLFAGTTDGNFDPTGTVTRAQMATVISKMIYGSDVNADSIKGNGKFTDTASFEGGWAEGYVNLCVNLGVVSGYGDGTFRPGNAVTTAEAVTMLINALKVDAGEGTWPMTVMAAAETIKLFTLEEELATKPGTNNALTRDELSVMVLNALYYSPEGGNTYIFNGVKFDNATDAYIASNFGKNGDVQVVPAQDTLAQETFELMPAEGIVVDNQATGAECTVVETSEKLVYVDLETGLDMIGHYVTAYYAEEYESEDEPGVAYCIVDEAKYVTVEKDIEDSTKEYRTTFGKSKVEFAQAGTYVDGAYEVKAIADADKEKADNELETEVDKLTTKGYVAGTYAPAGTYMVFEGKIVGFFAPATKKVVEITKVVTTAGKEKIHVDGKGLDNNEDADVVVEYEGIAKGDIAISVTAGTMTVLTKAAQIDGEITKFTKDKDGNDVIVVDGKTYGFADYSGLKVADFDFNITYTFYMDGDKVIAFEKLAGSVDLGNVVYVVGAYEIDTTDAYGNYVTNAYAQVVDMEGKESALLIGVEYTDAKGADLKEMTNLGVYFDETKVVGDDKNTGEIAFDADKYVANETFQVFEASKKSDEKKAGIMIIEKDAIATKPEVDETTLFADKLVGFEFDSKTTKATTDSNKALAFLADTTKFILVNGGAAKTLEVSVKTGLVNLPKGDYNVLATADKSGDVTLDVVVYVKDNMQLASDEVIYVSEAQIAEQAETADGTEIEVYFMNTKEFKTIVVADAFKKGEAGFYNYTFDATENVYDQFSEYKVGVTKAVTLKGLYGGNKLITLGDEFQGNYAADAVVIDTRSDKDLETSEYAEVESIEDLADLISAEVHVTMDVVVDTDATGDDKPVIAIFVLDVAEHKFEAGKCACGVAEPKV